ncbi:hypothetical protein RP20_CCG011622 [Aedes albopictus]|uniref:Putative secreted protein n=1 Tax=Aedes albopictus TaxID=7160 RepID=A0A023EBA0_AEDAL|nr:hypothetical protein RP20_CCG011622 [Aedes albopictus]
MRPHRRQLGSFLILSSGTLLVWLLLMSLFAFALLEVTEGRTIYYNPAAKDDLNNTVNTSNIFVSPLRCPPGYGLDRFRRCRKLVY